MVARSGVRGVLWGALLCGAVAVCPSACGGSGGPSPATDPGPDRDAATSDTGADPTADAAQDDTVGPRDSLPTDADTAPTDALPSDADAGPIDAPTPDRIARADLVIVTTQALRAPFDDLAAWKTRKGLPTRVLTMEEVRDADVGSPDDAAALRRALTTLAETGTRWVLLGGRPPHVPVRTVHCTAYNAAEDASLDEDFVSDLYFADQDAPWDGNGNGTFGEPDDGLGDMLPEVWLGRVPVDTVAEARTYVAKIMAYERAPVADYQDSAVLIGTVVAELDGITLCSTTVFESSIAGRFPESCDVTRMYAEECGDFPDAVPNSSQAQMDLWKAGRSHIVIHLGHGNIDTLGDIVPENAVGQIPPTSRPAVFMTCQCYSCIFDTDQRAACEHFLTDDWGGVIYLGNTQFGVGFPWETLFYDALLADLYDRPGATIGQLFADTLATYGQDAGGDLDAERSDFRWTQFTLHLMGDPSLRIWTRRPTAASAVVTREDVAGPGRWAVRVTSGGTPVKDATVALLWADRHLHVAQTNADGNAGFTWGPQGAPTGDGTLTVTGPTIVPVLQNL